jgi:hypothetical protein
MRTEELIGREEGKPARRTREMRRDDLRGGLQTTFTLVELTGSVMELSVGRLLFDWGMT